MTSSLAGLSEPATKKSRFAPQFIGSQRIFLCSATKTTPLHKTLHTDLHRFEFFQPSPAVCRFLTVDIDHIFAVNYLFDLPAEIRPHAVVFTAKGVQAFWLIERVALGGKARLAPISFAQDVGALLRRACSGDTAVDPVTPSKCRNPLYEGAETLFPADCPPYALKTLSTALRAFLSAQETHGEPETRPARPVPIWGDLSAGERNETIFHTIRQVAYRGGDFEKLAYELNAQCQPPLPESEVATIVRSVQKFMAKKYTPQESSNSSEPVPVQVREFMAEIGRKGGSRKTEKQKANLVKATNASRAVRSAQSIGRKAQIQELKKAGYTQTQIATTTGFSRSTIKRAWN